MDYFENIVINLNNKVVVNLLTKLLSAIPKSLLKIFSGNRGLVC